MPVFCWNGYSSWSKTSNCKFECTIPNMVKLKYNKEQLMKTINRIDSMSISLIHFSLSILQSIYNWISVWTLTKMNTASRAKMFREVVASGRTIFGLSYTNVRPFICMNPFFLCLILHDLSLLESRKSNCISQWFCKQLLDHSQVNCYEC